MDDEMFQHGEGLRAQLDASIALPYEARGDVENVIAKTVLPCCH